MSNLFLHRGTALLVVYTLLVGASDAFVSRRKSRSVQWIPGRDIAQAQENPSLRSAVFPRVGALLLLADTGARS